MQSAVLCYIINLSVRRSVQSFDARKGISNIIIIVLDPWPFTVGTQRMSAYILYLWKLELLVHILPLTIWVYVYNF